MSLPAGWAFAELGVSRIILEYTASPLVSFVRACESANESLLPWLVQLYALGPEQLATWYNRLIRAACAKGRIHAVQWLLGQAKIRDTKCPHAGKLLEIAAGGGCIKTMVVIMGALSGTPEVSSLKAACYQGHLPTAKWLVSNFNFPYLNNKGDGSKRCSPIVDNLVCNALSNGRLELAQWLVKTFDDRFEHWCDFSDFHMMLKNVCEKGYIHALRWIFEKWMPDGKPGLLSPYQLELLNGADIPPCIMYGACTNGHIRVAKYIATKFTMSKEDICEDYLTMDITQESIFYKTCRAGHLEIAQWLATKFRIPINEPSIRSREDYLRSPPHISSWLCKTFPRLRTLPLRKKFLAYIAAWRPIFCANSRPPKFQM